MVKLKYINKLLATLLLLLSTTTLLAADEKKKLYKWVDAQGNVHFSDEPHKDAKEVKVLPVPTTKMSPVKKPTFNIPKTNDSKPIDNYKSLSLTGGITTGVIRNNGSTITLTAEVSPKLDPDHRLRFYLDAKRIGTDSSASSVTVNNVEYGQHAATVSIVNKLGRTIKSSEIVSFQYMHHVNRKNN